MVTRFPSLVAVVAAAVTLALTSRAGAQRLTTDVPREARGLDVVEHLGGQLPLDLRFTDDERREVRLGDYFPEGNTRPAVVAMVYYRCPVVCSVVMAKLAESLNQVDYTTGKDYRVLLFSVKEEETSIDAAGAKARYLAAYERAEKDPAARAGWSFHTGSPESVKALGDALGFTFKRAENGEYAHPVAIFVVTPQGRISRYLYGFDYRPDTVKMSLLEASNGAIAQSIGERFMPFCYRYDPTAGTYTLQAFRLMRIGGVVTMVLVFGLVGVLRIREVARRRRVSRQGAEPVTTGGSPAGMVS